MAGESNEKLRIWTETDGPTDRDAEFAGEIARFIADRAFEFDDYECRAWALTDFSVWAQLSGREPELRLAVQGEVLDKG